jgi:hypothetical protein
MMNLGNSKIKLMIYNKILKDDYCFCVVEFGILKGFNPLTHIYEVNSHLWRSGPKDATKTTHLKT